MGLQKIFEKKCSENHMVFLVLWTVLIILSVSWNLYQNKKETIERARIEARTIFEHNLAYRRWNTMQGGVYTRVTEENQPNPYIFTPDRDLETKDGIKLTLVNPFRMTRQAYDLLKKQSPLAAINRTVSLNPYNPENEPDEWERKALLAFEGGTIEVSEITKIEGMPYMRLLRTYKAEKGCLKCHAGYKEGDVRGAMSVAVPMQPYYETAMLSRKTILITHFILWLLGTGAITLFSMGLKRYQSAQKRLEAQLFQAQKMESLGHFAGGVAHDFNNLLSAINGFTFLLHKKLKARDKEAADYVEQIMIASKLGKNLTSNLLAFGRKQIVRPKPVRLNETITNISEILKTLISEDIELKISLSDDEVFVFADEHQIEQVVINLCSNAKDAMPSGGDLNIQTGYQTLYEQHIGRFSTIPPGSYMILSVSDTGTGISADHISHIFEPFYTTKEPGRGTGLGLSIIYSIVTQHNGFIDVISEVNKGTTFKIFFPAVKDSILDEHKEEALAESQIFGNGETILIAEDDETTRKFLEVFLRQKGYRVILAEDGEDAIKKYEKNKDKIDMLILDIVLPKKNGKAVYDLIKSQNPGIKALFMSGYTDDIVTVRSIFEEGMEFISKPLDVPAFIIRVQEILKKI